MVNQDWVKQLQSTPLKKLSRYTVSDYIKICRSSFLKPTVIEMLDKLKQNPEMDDLFLADMYILAFVYRNTSRFEAIVKGGKFDPPLLPNDATKNSASQDKENESAANATNPFFKRISDLQTFRAQKIEHLHIEANRFREKMLNLAGTFLCGSTTKCKKNQILFFTEIYARFTVFFI